MVRYIFRRFLQGIVALFVLSIIMFLLARVTGSPVELLLPPDPTIQEEEYMTEMLGLDKPLAEQYYSFITKAIRGGLGDSIRYGKPAFELVAQRLPNSLRLIVAALVFAIATGVPLGIIAGAHRGSFVDQAARVTAAVGMATPGFWIGLMLMYIFAVGLRILPVARMGGPAHYILPTVSLGLPILAGLARLLRSSMIEVLDSEFMKLARIKGVSEAKVLWRHCLRNALIPVLSLAGVYIALLISETIVIETVFAWPGVGRLAYEGVIYRDYPLVQAVVLTSGTLIIIVNFFIDILYSYIDPRIRYA